MVGPKLPQLKEAMGQILSEIYSDDFFTLILFSDFAQVIISTIIKTCLLLSEITA